MREFSQLTQPVYIARVERGIDPAKDHFAVIPGDEKAWRYSHTEGKWKKSTYLAKQVYNASQWAQPCDDYWWDEQVFSNTKLPPIPGYARDGLTKLEPYFFWSRVSASSVPVLYAIRREDDTVWYLSSDNVWVRSTIYTHDSLTKQFNNPGSGSGAFPNDRFTAVQPAELIGTSTPKLPAYDPGEIADVKPTPTPTASPSQFIPPPDLTKAPMPSPYVSFFENPFKSPFDPQEIGKQIWNAGNLTAFKDIAAWLRDNLELVEARIKKLEEKTND